MQNKNLIIVIVVVVVLILAGVLFMTKGKDKQSGSQNENTESQPASQKPSVKDSLIGLLENASGIKCSVSDENGKYTVIAKGERVRIEGMSFSGMQNQASAEQKGTMISDGEWAYMWNSDQGMKFNLKEMEALSPEDQQNSQEKTGDWKNWAKEMQASGAKYDCNATVATDADFTPPKDVTFQDLGDLFKNMMQSMPSGDTSVPAIPAMPNGAEPQL